MSIHLSAATIKSKSSLSKLRIIHEGLVKTDYSSAKNQSGNVKRSKLLKRIYCTYIVPHVFLGILILSYFLFPESYLNIHIFQRFCTCPKRALKDALI